MICFTISEVVKIYHFYLTIWQYCKIKKKIGVYLHSKIVGNMSKIDTVYQNILNFQIKTFLKMKKLPNLKNQKSFRI